MQTCKDLNLSYQPKIHILDILDNWYEPVEIHTIKVPAGTYVQKMEDRYGKEKLYRIKAWRGMPKEYKKHIDEGLVIGYNLVKGKF
jgi:hypothetical protein